MPRRFLRVGSGALGVFFAFFDAGRDGLLLRGRGGLDVHLRIADLDLGTGGQIAVVGGQVDVDRGRRSRGTPARLQGPRSCPCPARG